MGTKSKNAFSEASKDLLHTILEGTASETGAGFFRALVKNLSRALGTTGAWVTEYLVESGRLRAHAFWLRDQWVEDYEYNIAGTPCEPVVAEKRLVHVPENVIDLYPRDPDLKEVGAVSYMGVPLLDTEGVVLGHLAVLDSEPLPEEPHLLALFRIFAARAAAELQRLHASAELQRREEKLAGLVDSALDAIIELDHDLRITRVNPATEKVFRCNADGLIGRHFKSMLSSESHTKVSSLLESLKDRPPGKRFLWIPKGLTAECDDGEKFPAEGTLSCFEVGRETFHTLILRNVNDRREAEQMIRSLTIETQYLREELRALHNFDEIVGESEPLFQVLHDIQQVADVQTTVLILGETGTGKELIARAIHYSSRRKEKCFVKVNCAAIPADLMESELFGHEKGAFTGAISRREGRFALAHEGTIFLDEIGELPIGLQSKLLRVLQEGEFEPIGSAKTRKVDARVVAATNRDLQQAVEKGGFREDLFYRLNVFPIRVPPLRERGSDIALLASAFVKKIARSMGRQIEPPSEEHIHRLAAYNWPGNVRELHNVIERAIITSQGGRLNLDRALPATNGGVSIGQKANPTEQKILTAKELQRLERENLLRALESCQWRVAGKTGVARLLGLPPSTVSSRVKALGIKRPH